MKLLIGIDDTDNLESRGKLGVLTMNEVEQTAAESGIGLAGLTGTGGGVIVRWQAWACIAPVKMVASSGCHLCANCVAPIRSPRSVRPAISIGSAPWMRQILRPKHWWTLANGCDAFQGTVH